MNKKKNNLVIKIPSSVICPNCGEKYSFYISKKGKKKGILPGEYLHESFFNSYYGDLYDCYTCGYHWKSKGEYMNIEVCDLCKNKSPNRRFKVRMSEKGYYQKTAYRMSWMNLWQPYEKISICEDCAEKLFNIKKHITAEEIVKSHKKQVKGGS